MTIELSCLTNTILNKEKGERISLEPRGAGVCLCVCVLWGGGGGGREVSPRKSVVQSACQYDVTYVSRQ